MNHCRHSGAVRCWGVVIDKWKLFERAREPWPQSVRVVPTERQPGFEAEPKLVAVYRSIEASCDPTGEWTDSDNWTSVANWSFHQALWKLAGQATTETLILRDDVTFEMFDYWMRFNLSDDDWSAQRQEYEDSPSRFQ